MDQDIAAEDHIKVLHEGHSRIVGEIQPAEIHGRANQGLDLQTFFASLEVLLRIVRGQNACAVAPINSCPARFRSRMDANWANPPNPASERLNPFGIRAVIAHLPSLPS